MKYAYLKTVLFFVSCFGWNTVAAQYAITTLEEDTITYEKRTLTQRLDSLAIVHSGYATTQPGGNTQSLGGVLDSDYSNGFQLFRQTSPAFKTLQSYYAGLPHLGFYYAFGSRGLQNIHLDYQQTIARKFNVHLVYDGHLLNNQAGLLKHSGYKNSTVQLLMNYRGQRYQSLYFMDYYFGNRNSSRGVTDENDLAIYPLKLIDVKNTSAFAKYNVVNGGTQHLISLSNDSLVKHGFVYQNELKLENRKYSESLGDVLKYAAIYKDSSNTYDHYQWYLIQNEAGYFVQSKRLNVSARAYHHFWKYKNQGFLRDSLKVGVNADLLFKWASFSLDSKFDFGFLGAIGEVMSKSHLKWKGDRFNIGANLYFENFLPSPYIRHYYGNSIQWDLQNLALQQDLTVGGFFNWEEKIPFSVKLNWSNLSNHYWLIDNEMRNDTLKNVSVLNTSVNARFKVKTFHFDPYVAVNVSSGNLPFVPLLDARFNVYWNQKLFSTKKFDFILGVTGRFKTKHEVTAYNHLADLYEFSNSSVYYQEALFRMDIYTGFQIDNFRFFIRYENLDSFWNRKDSYTTSAYPIAPGLIRIGLTWDFFN